MCFLYGFRWMGTADRAGHRGGGVQVGRGRRRGQVPTSDHPSGSQVDWIDVQPTSRSEIVRRP